MHICVGYCCPPRTRQIGRRCGSIGQGLCDRGDPPWSVDRPWGRANEPLLFSRRAMNPTLVSPSQARRPAKRSTPSPQYWPGTPLTFLLAGFAWLAASYVLGVALIIGLVYGTSLPTWLKTIHVHGALAGGIVQLAIGGLLL